MIEDNIHPLSLHSKLFILSRVELLRVLNKLSMQGDIVPINSFNLSREVHVVFLPLSMLNGILYPLILTSN